MSLTIMSSSSELIIWTLAYCISILYSSFQNQLSSLIYHPNSLFHTSLRIPTSFTSFCWDFHLDCLTSRTICSFLYFSSIFSLIYSLILDFINASICHSNWITSWHIFNLLCESKWRSKFGFNHPEVEWLQLPSEE